MCIQGQVVTHLWLRACQLMFSILLLFVLLSLLDLLKEFFSLFEEFQCSLRFRLRPLESLLSFVVYFLEEREKGVGIHFFLLAAGRQIENILIVRSCCYVFWLLFLSKIDIIISLFSPITTWARNLWYTRYSSLLWLRLLPHFVRFLSGSRRWIIRNNMCLKFIDLILFARLEGLKRWLTTRLNGSWWYIYSG